MAVAVCALVVGCSSSTSSRWGAARVVVEAAQFPVALTAQPDGGLLYAERVRGVVRRVDARGRLEAEPIARVSVSTVGQRGLLGVAASPEGATFVAYTGRNRGRPLIVEQVTPSRRVVWHGPNSARLANGGHLVYDTTRRMLLIGIGDLLERARVTDPAAPNGKLLLLDPQGTPDQKPTVLSMGWNNPFAFTVLDDGAVWVADNVPGERGERLARGDEGIPTHVTRLPADTVPAAVAALSRRLLVVCSYAQVRTFTYSIRAGSAARQPGPGDGTRCATGIASRQGGRRLWVADERSIAVQGVATP